MFNSIRFASSMAGALLEVLAVAVAVVNVVHGFPSGAPVEACGRLLPRHLARPSDNSHSPYYVTASAGSYGHGYSDPIQVTIIGEIFKGFIIAAIDPHSHKRIGKWLHTEGTQTLPCAAITHTNSKPKKQVIVYWQPPFGHSGDVVFEATVVKHYASYFAHLIAQVDKGSNKAASKASPSRHVSDVPPPPRPPPPHIQHPGKSFLAPIEDENDIDLHHPIRFFHRFASYKKK